MLPKEIGLKGRVWQINNLPIELLYTILNELEWADPICCHKIFTKSRTHSQEPNLSSISKILRGFEFRSFKSIFRFFYWQVGNLVSFQSCLAFFRRRFWGQPCFETLWKLNGKTTGMMIGVKLNASIDCLFWSSSNNFEK